MSDNWICLLYHDVVDGEPTLAGGRQHFAVSAQTFRDHLDAIEAAGLHGCSIAETLQRGGRGCAAISFDDGDQGLYDNAFPALHRKGMTATFFITTSWVGRQGFVSWDQLREMKAAGMSIQSHTHTHPFLSELDAEGLGQELLRSKEALDAALDQDTTEIALPGGDQPRRALRHLILESGYRILATSVWGRNGRLERASGDALLRVYRCTVRGQPSESEFRRMLEFDPWLLVRRRTRGAALNGLRTVVGPSRYAPLRRSFLEKISSLTGGS